MLDCKTILLNDIEESDVGLSDGAGGLNEDCAIDGKELVDGSLDGDAEGASKTFILINSLKSELIVSIKL